jgi:hypothetical protein
VKHLVRCCLLWAAAVAGAVHAAPAPAPVVLDRLFFSAEERRALDRPPRADAPSLATQVTPVPAVREALPPPRRPSPASQESRSVEAEPPKVTGYVKRSSGNDTIWLNQQPRYRRSE